MSFILRSHARRLRIASTPGSFLASLTLAFLFLLNASSWADSSRDTWLGRRAEFVRELQDPSLSRQQKVEVRRQMQEEALRMFEESKQSALAVSSVSSSADGIWHEIPAPTARADHSAIYDSARHRMIVFGGNDWWDYKIYDQTFALSLDGDPTWTALPAAPFGPSQGHSAIYDPIRDRMVVFGGSALGNQVWALSLGENPTWTQLTPSGEVPLPRQEHSAIYDPVRDRMIVFGGAYGVGNDEVWALSLGDTPTWTRITPAGASPSPPSQHTAIYDPIRDRMLIWGVTYLGQSAVWSVSLGENPTWTQLQTAGASPDFDWEPVSIYDPVHDQMVVYPTPYPVAPWTLSLSGTPTWSPVEWEGDRPGEYYRCSAIYDPAGQRMILFGGEDCCGVAKDGLFQLALNGPPVWTRLHPNGEPPPQYFPSSRFLSAYDPVRENVLFLGGDGGTWQLEPDAPSAWRLLTSGGAQSLIYDPIRDRFVGFSSDVSTLSLVGSPAWSSMVTTGEAPPAFWGQSAIYDSIQDRMIIFGGSESTDVWALSFAGVPSWSKLSTVGGPPPARSGHTAIFDPVRDRMIVFGGAGQNDVWALSLGGTPTWTMIQPLGVPPTSLEGFAIYDRVRDRMVVVGGEYGVQEFGVWSLSLDATPAWTQLAPEGQGELNYRFGSNGTYDPVNDRIVLIGGYMPESTVNDAWTLDLSTRIAFDFKPDDLNLVSNGAYVTGYLTPPTGSSASQIDVSSIRLNAVVAPASERPAELRPDGSLKLKFFRSQLRASLRAGDHVPVTATGKMAGQWLVGSDHIAIQGSKVHSPAAGQVLAGGSLVDVTWDPVSEVSVVTLVSSWDDGVTWQVEAANVANTGSFRWAVPNVSSNTARVGLVIVYESDATGIVPQAELAQSEAFSISFPTGAGDRPAEFLLQSANPSQGAFRVRFSLPNARPASMTLFDMAGRRVATRRLEGLGPGWHTVEFSGHRLGAGLYLVRLTQEKRSLTSRIAFVR